MNTTYIEFPEKGLVSVKSEITHISNLGPMEVVIKNETSIISTGTELARLNGMEEGTEFPFRPGYGSIGRILTKGENIKDFNIGDRVFYAGTHASIQRFTHGTNHQWSYLFPVDDNIDPIEASVGCLAQISLTAPTVTDLKLGDTVAVFGLGMIGILAAMLYKLRGAKVIGVDPVKERCNLAKKVGIDCVIQSKPDEQVAKILELTDQKGADITVDAVGHSSVISNCIKATSLFGQIVLLGSPRASYTGNLTDVFWDIHLKGLVLRGAHMWRYPVQQQRGSGGSVEENFSMIFELIKTRQLDARQLISHVIQPQEAAVAYQGLQNNSSKYTCVVIDWR